ncbi:2256_t:CDS:2 [Dentiscutata heterogama]|uniref:2256_t:CDS:1 n=1 Tax=Dentiscutata heterogama TaxID=1316150 RepID=A0ACA9M519_9GLOM|nr:2256_t:CDS:2 [Dentiscutata heterogama]
MDNKEERLDISLEFSTAKEVLPLLHAVRTRDQDATWKIYQELQQTRKLHLLSPQQHSIILKSFDINGKYLFTKIETIIFKKEAFLYFRSNERSWSRSECNRLFACDECF